MRNSNRYIVKSYFLIAVLLMVLSSHLTGYSLTKEFKTVSSKETNSSKEKPNQKISVSPDQVAIPTSDVCFEFQKTIVGFISCFAPKEVKHISIVRWKVFSDKYLTTLFRYIIATNAP